MESRPIVKPSDLLSIPDYLKRRSEILKTIVALKALRRVEIGPWVSMVFENRATTIYQIQEMLRIEHITDPAAIEHEIETYSDLLPGASELSATFFIEITDAKQRAQALAKLGGIEKSVFLRVGERKIPAFDKRPIDPRFERPGQATAVYYLGFKLEESQKKNLSTSDVWLDITHPQYRHSAALPEPTKQSLALD